MCRWADVPMCECADVRMCEYANQNIGFSFCLQERLRFMILIIRLLFLTGSLSVHISLSDIVTSSHVASAHPHTSAHRHIPPGPSPGPFPVGRGVTRFTCWHMVVNTLITGAFPHIGIPIAIGTHHRIVTSAHPHPDSYRDTSSHRHMSHPHIRTHRHIGTSAHRHICTFAHPHIRTFAHPHPDSYRDTSAHFLKVTACAGVLHLSF
jgi:hypothetical protein